MIKATCDKCGAEEVFDGNYFVRNEGKYQWVSFELKNDKDPRQKFDQHSIYAENIPLSRNFCKVCYKKIIDGEKKIKVKAEKSIGSIRQCSEKELKEYYKKY